MHVCRLNAVFATILLSLADSTSGWSLSNLRLERDDFRIIHVSVFYVRAFLCVERTAKLTSLMVRNHTAADRKPTLIETGWPENMLPVKPRAFPDDLAHAHHDQACNDIIQAIGSAVDMSTGDLWILDRGSTFCAPKTITFDLIGRNEETHRFSLPHYPFASIHTGPEMRSAAQHRRNSTRIFFTLVEHDFIVVYAPAERSWWRVKFITNDLIVVPKGIAFTSNGSMYLVDDVHHLWLSSDMLQKVSSQKGTKSTANYFQLSVILVDDVLGTASSMIVDPADQLYYFMPRDGVVVRWNTRKRLRAENHDVLYFTNERVVQVVFGAKGSVWTIEERANVAQEHSHRVLSHFTGASLFTNYIYKSVAL